MGIMLIERVRPAAIVVLVLILFGGAGTGRLLYPTVAAQQPERPAAPQNPKKDAGAPPAAGAAQDNTDAIMQLKKRMLDAARKTYEMDMLRFRNQQLAGTDTLCLWSRRWLDAQVDLAKAKDERLPAYREHLERMRVVERMAKAYAATGQGRAADATAAEYSRIQAELLLVQAKAKAR
jgi:hypothetical protein